jgi:cation:H+ antiporter
MALMNMVSSNINQWTVLVAMIPIVYSISTGKVSAIHFDSHQKVEIFLTIAQSALGMILLVNMEFRWYEALGLFSLWFVQFVIPTLREEITWVYLFWLYVELILAFVGKRKLTAFKEFRELVRKHF